jgi:hypothetical protein
MANEEVPMQTLNSSSEVLYKTIMRLLMEDGGRVHIETAITAAAAVGGLALLRSSRIDLRSLAEGTRLVSPEIDANAPRFLSLMMNVLAAIGMEAQGGWEDPIPPEHAPKRSGRDLAKILEPQARELYLQFSVPESWTAGVGALAAVKIVHLGASKGILSLNKGKALALAAFTESALSVPRA